MTDPYEPAAPAAPVAPAQPTPVTASPEPTAEPDRPKEKSSSFLRELPILIAVALVLALLIKAFLVQAFFIPSGSMENTLHVGDRVLVNKLVYHTRSIHRGEIVVFNGKDTSFASTPEFTATHSNNVIARFFRSIGSAIGVSPPGEKDFIKRVIGVGGDTVQCCDAQGRVMVNGVSLNEPYIFEDNHQQFGPITVPKGHLWVMGDHRGDSADSRAHLNDPDHGFVPTHKVIGRAFIKVWPFSHFGVLHVPKTFNQKALRGINAPFGGAPTVALGALGAVPIMRVRRRRRARRGRRPGRAAVVP